METRQGRFNDIGVLAARLGLGVVMFAQGWQKLADWGLGATADMMGGGGVPVPQVSVYAVTFGELLAGAALIAGVAVRAAGAGTLFLMVGAIVFVNGPRGFYSEDGGLAFPLAVATAALLLVVTGSGRYGLDPYFKSLLERRPTVKAA